MDNTDDLLKQLNEKLQEYGMLEVLIVDPRKLKGQEKNARYFPAEKYKTLVNNIKKEKKLESVPLVMRNKKGELEIISGHHRVEAAIEAGLDKILVMVYNHLSRDKVISKQLSHNSLTGLDDKTILAELFQEIQDIELKMSTGLNDEVAKINYESINFRLGSFKEFIITFLPEDEELYDKTMEDILKESMIGQDSAVRLTSMKYYDKFADTIRKIKKTENIKSNGIALNRLVELANERMEDLKSKSVS